MMSSAARVSCAVGAALLLIGTAPFAQTRIHTPFEVVSLWSEDMLNHLADEGQPACSGEKSADCKRFNEGICDGMVNVAFGDAFPGFGLPWIATGKQTGTAAPQGVQLAVAIDPLFPVPRSQALGRDEPLELKFECANIRAPGDCPTNVFHIGSLRTVEVQTPNGDRLFDLISRSRVHPEGRVLVSLDEAMRKVLDSGTHPFYGVRVAAQCFVVPAVTIERKLPVHAGPSATSKSLGAIIARVTRFHGIEWSYRATDGKEVSFEPDVAEGDWGYQFLMEQTILDRRGEWVQLPRRPFPQPVWLHVPRPSLGEFSLQPDQAYTLTKAVTAKSKDGKRTMVFDDGDNVIVVAIRGRQLEIRKEEEVDEPCADNPRPPNAPKPETFLVNAEELYDADLHLQLGSAYPKGC